MNTRTPKYKVIAQNIEDQIINGKYKDGDLLPSEAQLSEFFSVSRITIRKSLETLREKNIIESAQGIGSIVKTKFVHELSEKMSFQDQLVPQDITNKVINFMIVTPDSQLKKKLQLNQDDQVYFIERLRYHKNRLIILEICYLPVSLFPDLSYSNLEGSIFDYVENSIGYHITKSDDELLPEIVDNNISNLLEVPENSAVIKIESINYFYPDIPFQYSIAYHNSNNYQLKISMTKE